MNDHHDEVCECTTCADKRVDPEIVNRYLARAEGRYAPPTRRPTTAERHAIARACLNRGNGPQAVCKALRVNGRAARALINTAAQETAA